MIHWLYIAAASALLYGGYNFFIKAASAHINQVLAAITLQASALGFGCLILLLMKVRGQNLLFSVKGIQLAALAGLCVGSAEILAFYVFSLGVPASHGVPVIVGLTITAATLYGLLFFGESLTAVQALGVILVIMGIALLAGFSKEI